MGQVITINQSKGSRGTGILVVRSDSSGHIDLASANSVVAANTTGETVSNLYIAEIVWSSSGSSLSWTISRGSNTVFECFGSNGYVDFQANQMRLENGPNESQANVVFTKSGNNGNIIIKLHKQSGE